jgi:hypothetical protein
MSRETRSSHIYLYFSIQQHFLHFHQNIYILTVICAPLNVVVTGLTAHKLDPSLYGIYL